SLAVALAVLAAGSAAVVADYAFRQRELANQRGALAAEKARSEQAIREDLRRVLLGRAEAVRTARPPGYRRRVWADLHEAAALPGGGADSVRATLLACRGDPIGLDPVADPASVPRRDPPQVPAGFGKQAGQAAGGDKTAA